MRTTFRLLMLIALIGLPAAPALPEVEFIDTHIHMFRTSTDPCSYDDAISQALETMDAFGVQMSLVMPTPHEEQGDACDDHTGLALVAGDSSGRFAFLGGGGTLNPLIQDAVNGVAVDEDEFSAVANDILASGAIGFGELVAEHFSLHANHPYMSAPPDHPLFLRLADIAAANNVPIDLHMEAVPCVETRDGVCGIPRPTDLSDVNPEFIPENISALERLLAHNPNARIIWVHAGWDNTGYRTVDLMRRLLNSYPNLYMNIKMSGGSTTERPNLNRPLDDDLQLKPEWLDLISDFPDRFTIGTDVKHLTDELDRIKGDLKRARTFLNLLPEDLAQKVGIINPTCIYALAPCIRFSAAQYGVGENGGSVEITVERVGYTGSEVSVDYTVNDGTATVGVDYNVAALTGTLTFASGETTKTITISIVNDSEVEDNETINLNLTNRTGDGFLWWPLTAVLTIANDDVSFRFKDLFYTVREGKPSGTTTIRVEKLGGTPETVTVNYATSDGTATAGADYGTTTGTLTFSPGDPGVKEFTVPILNDTIPESHETVNLSLSNPINPGGSASLATPNTAVLTIL
ncbi:MAG: amidohydrolase family protein, partial [Deltaproteobacteria bacterium]|nr:amidohydrolase family protein [Deltaproteobacteria bacterium]